MDHVLLTWWSTMNVAASSTRTPGFASNPGCVSSGATHAECEAKIREAIELYEANLEDAIAEWQRRHGNGATPTWR
jgi:hypothetical protein